MSKDILNENPLFHPTGEIRTDLTILEVIATQVGSELTSPHTSIEQGFKSLQVLLNNGSASFSEQADSPIHQSVASILHHLGVAINALSDKTSSKHQNSTQE